MYINWKKLRQYKENDGGCWGAHSNCGNGATGRVNAQFLNLLINKFVNDFEHIY